MGEHGNRKGYKRKARLRISFQITAIVLAILILGSIASAVVLTTSLNELTESSKEKVAELASARVLASLGYIMDLIRDALAKEGVQMSSAAFYEQLDAAVISGSSTAAQQAGDDLLQMMVDSGMFGLDVMYYALPPGAGVSDEPVVVVSSDDEYLYGEVPEQVAELAENNKEYKLFEDGIPEMGLEGAHLVTVIRVSGENPENVLWHFDFKPMDELMADIDSFYAREKRNVYVTLGIILGLSVLGLLIVSFLILGHLINKKISRPVEELSETAEKVMTGDLDVRAEIRRGEEFSTLKKAFNSMISNLSGILEGAAKGRDAGRNLDLEEPGTIPAKPRRRSSLLVQITALFAALLILTGALAVIAVNRSISNLVDNSKQKMIEMEAEWTMSGHDLVRVVASNTMGAAEMSEMLTKFLKAFADRDKEAVGKLQTGLLLDNLIEHGLFTLVLMVSTPIPGMSDTSLVAGSTDDKYLFTEPNKKILEMIDKGEDSWEYFPDGIPEMGFNEPYLVTTYFFEVEGFPAGSWTVDFRPMTRQMKSIDSFYSSKANRLYLLFGLTTGISVILTIIIVYFALGYLLRKKITEPVDELTGAAEMVLEGDLDVDVQIRPGEELESLKKAFNEMVKSFRDIVARSAG